jgi:molybdate transport system permease protein
LLQALGTAAEGSDELSIMLLSARIAGTAVLFAAPIALALAWCLLRLRPAWAVAVQLLLLLPLVLPPVVSGYLLLLAVGRQSPLGQSIYQLFGVHLAFSQAAAVLAAAVVGLPLFVEAIRLSLSSVDRRLVDVSASLGRGPWQTFWRVYFPLAWPGLLGGAVLAFARALGEFGATMVLAGNIPGETRQIPLAVYVLLSQPGREAEVLLLVLGLRHLEVRRRQRAERGAA